MQDYEFEPQLGLPQPLPPGERILWQGAPDWRGLVVHALHIRVLAAYFAALIVWRVADGLESGMPVADVAQGTATLLGLSMIPIVLVLLYAWALARTTVYTITDKRVVMRFGLALPVVLNLPFGKIASAALARHGDGVCDIALKPQTGRAAGAPVSTLLVWPHIRPGQLWNPEPSLRAIAQPEQVARLLADALATANGQLPVVVQSADEARPSGLSAGLPVAVAG